MAGSGGGGGKGGSCTAHASRSAASNVARVSAPTPVKHRKTSEHVQTTTFQNVSYYGFLTLSYTCGLKVFQAHLKDPF